MAQTLDEFLASQGVESPTIAGTDVVVFQGDQKVGWATNLKFTNDTKIQPIKVLGHHGNIGFKSMGFEGKMDIGALVLEAGFDDALKTPENGELMSMKPYTFKIMNLVTNQVLYTIKGAICGSWDVEFKDGQMVAKNTSWQYTSAVAGDGVS